MHLLSSRRLRAVAAGAVALMIALTGCTAEEQVTFSPPPQVEGPLPEDMTAQMQTAVQDAMTAAGASGAIVGVWAPWSGQWVTALGTQAQDDDTPVSTDMSFRIADVTRLMTCDVLYGLADDDLVELDAPVADLVSGVAGLDGVTLLDLCNGTGGIGSSEAKLKGAWLNTPEREWSPLEISGYGLGAKPSTPHTTWRDSDAGYMLLGLALQRVARSSPAELIQQYVATPLELTATRLPGPAAAAPGEISLRGNYLPAVDGGYNCSAPVDITTSSASIGFTDAGAVSNITDLGRYTRALAAQTLRGADPEPDRFGSPLPVSNSAPSWYQATGGGFVVGSMVGGHGWVPGYATAAYSDPASGFTVAVTLNNSTSGANIAAWLAWELAALGSKAPAAEGQTAPEFGLPFTAEQYHGVIADAALTCVAPAEG